MGAFGGLSWASASGFHPNSVQSPPGPMAGVDRRSFKGEISKTDVDSPRNAPGLPGYSKTKSKYLTKGLYVDEKNIF
jgi:hypothetical protein